jgi:hypothetical protein
MVAGAIALLLQANSNLSWRDVQYILANTSTQINPEEDDWVINAAGYHHSYRYGFGLVDTLAAVKAAQSWQSVSRSISIISNDTTLYQRIPNDGTAISSIITIAEQGTAETIEIVFDSTHLRGSELQIILTAPSGTQSILADLHGLRMCYRHHYAATHSLTH